jgi:tight adherence protein B
VAALPVIVLSAGEGLGARPWAFLVGHPAGVACLGGGVALVLAGLAWIDRIAVTATSSHG